MRKLVSVLSVPAVNLGTIVYAQLPTFDLFEQIFKLLLLIATFIFTLIRIFVLLKNKNSDKDTG